ncbi:phage holin family protein [Actinospica sp. MGRD01-02]|uniref:Phage holin family protein n=2 Tax=Actinospica acidithermotolerans TaxID=2828514 RepID=A0A941E812_9ACTN|nr:phage holin family protein [Actinospica acidithermotolerans]
MTMSEEQARELDSISTVGLVNLAVEQTQLIVRQEVALARAELTRKAKQAALGSAVGAVAGLFALIALLCAVGAAVAGFANLVPVWAAALIVAAILLGMAGIAGLAARQRFTKASPSAPPDVVASVKADVTEVRRRLHR